MGRKGVYPDSPQHRPLFATASAPQGPLVTIFDTSHMKQSTPARDLQASFSQHVESNDQDVIRLTLLRRANSS
jgi:hypothetical protein